MGEPEDFAALVEREYEPLVRAATVIIGDAEMANEVVQEALTRALTRWRRISRYDRPGAWVRLVTVRLAMRASGKRRRDGVGRPVPEEGACDVYPDPDLAAAIQALPALDRAVIVLHHLYGMPVAEVADAVGATQGAVKVRLHRARAKLAGALAQEAADAPRP